MSPRESASERSQSNRQASDFASRQSAALRYAGRGWPVLPLAGMGEGSCSCGRTCDSPAKHPLTRHGVHDATTDVDRIRRWWRRWPDANVGVATGAASGVAVVDVDPIAGGRWSLEVIRAAGRDLPVTLLAFTGGGGFHLFYAVPAGVRVGNTAGRLPNMVDTVPGIDLRGDGGYVVAAPSVHASGIRYRWADQATQLAALPTWLSQPPTPDFIEVPPRVSEKGSSRYGAAALANEVDAVRRLVVGERNAGLNRAAFVLGRLVGGGELAAEVVFGELLLAALATGLGEREATRTIRSGLEAGARAPRRPADLAGTGGPRREPTGGDDA